MWSGWVKPMPDSAVAAIDVWQRQIPHLSGTIHAWWWVPKLSVPKPKTRIHNIGCSQFSCLGSIGINKPKRHGTPNRATTNTQQAHARFLAHSFTHTETLAQQQWIDWAIWMCAKFQRTSSAVEGRNGYLSRLHHFLTEQTLKVLTVIHNFDLKRDDDTTAAQRLFGKPFPNLFDWVVLNMRVTQANSKARISKSPPYKLSCLKLLSLHCQHIDKYNPELAQ